MAEIYNIENLISTASEESKQYGKPDYKFRDKTWRVFNIKHNINLIMNQSDPYFAHDWMVFAGFVSYLSFGGNRRLMQSMISAAALDAIAELENSLKERVQANPVLTDYYIRYVKIGPRFWQEAYYACGGALNFLPREGVRYLNEQLASKRKPLEDVISIVRVMHYVALNQRMKSSRRPSTSGAVCSLRSVYIDIRTENDEKDNGRRTLINNWSAYREKAAFLYALSDVTVPGLKISLFDWIFSGKFEHRYDGLEIPMVEVIRKAAFINRNVLSLRADKELHDDFSDLVHDVEPLDIAAPKIGHDLLEFVHVNHRLGPLK